MCSVVFLDFVLQDCLLFCFHVSEWLVKEMVSSSLTECIWPPLAAGGRRPAIFLYINKTEWKCGLGILSRHCCKSHNLVVSSPVCVHGHVVSDTFTNLHVSLPFFSAFPHFYRDTFSHRLRVTTWECVESGCPGILPHSLDSMTSLCMSAPLTEMLFFFR